jgi:profilin
MRPHACTHVQVPVAEAKVIVGAFGNPSKILSEGVKINGQKYLAVRYDDRSIYAKKVRATGPVRVRARAPAPSRLTHARAARSQGTGGLCCVKTKQAVLIAVYAEGAQPGECNQIVEKLGDYLISVGY